MIRFHIISALPRLMSSYVEESLLARAQRNKLARIEFYPLSRFTSGKSKDIDDRPYGGGPGMVLRAEPILAAVEHIKSRFPRATTILFSHRGKQWTQADARALSKHSDIILIAGRYEGIDERVRKVLRPRVTSIGPYILTGGELPALVVVDSTLRHVRGFLGEDSSLEEKRLVVPVELYTRPRVIEYRGKKYRVPPVLLSGDHAKIEDFYRRHHI